MVPNVVVFKVPEGVFSDAEAKIHYINCDSLATICSDVEARRVNSFVVVGGTMSPMVTGLDR